METWEKISVELIIALCFMRSLDLLYYIERKSFPMSPLIGFGFPHTPTRFTTFPVPSLIAFRFNPVHAFSPLLKYTHILYKEIRHTPTYKEVAQPIFVYPPPLVLLFVCLLAFFEKSFRRICRPHTRLRIFDFTILIFHPTHYNLTFSLPAT